MSATQAAGGEPVSKLLVGRWDHAVRTVLGHDIFISYRWSDAEEYAHALYNALKAKKYNCFLDAYWLPPGAPLEEYERAARRSRVFVLIATPGFTESTHIDRELAAYWNAHDGMVSKYYRRVVPISIADCLAPFEVSDTKAFDDTPWKPLVGLVAERELEDAYAKHIPSDRIIDRISGSYRLVRGDLMLIALAVAIFVLVLIGALVQYRIAQGRLDQVGREVEKAKQELVKTVDLKTRLEHESAAQSALSSYLESQAAYASGSPEDALFRAFEAWRLSEADDPLRRIYAIHAVQVATKFPSIVATLPDRPHSLLFDPWRDRVAGLTQRSFGVWDLTSGNSLIAPVPVDENTVIQWKGMFSHDGRVFLGYLRLPAASAGSWHIARLDRHSENKLDGISGQPAALNDTGSSAVLSHGQSATQFSNLDGGSIQETTLQLGDESEHSWFVLNTARCTGANCTILRIVKGRAQIVSFAGRGVPAGVPDFLNDQGEVRSAIVSADSRFVALSIQADKSWYLQWWDLKSGKNRKTESLRRSLDIQDITQDGAAVVACGTYQGESSVIVWRPGAEKTLTVKVTATWAYMSGGEIGPAARFSMDGSTVWICRRNGEREFLEAWDSARMIRAGRRIDLLEREPGIMSWNRDTLRYPLLRNRVARTRLDGLRPERAIVSSPPGFKPDLAGISGDGNSALLVRGPQSGDWRAIILHLPAVATAGGFVPLKNVPTGLAERVFVNGSVFAVVLNPINKMPATLDAWHDDGSIILVHEAATGRTTRIRVRVSGSVEAMALDEHTGEYAVEVVRKYGPPRVDRVLVSGNWRAGTQRGSVALPGEPWFILTGDPRLAILGGDERSVQVLDLGTKPPAVAAKLSSPPARVAAQYNEASPWLYALLSHAGRLRVAGAAKLLVRTESGNEITIEEPSGAVQIYDAQGRQFVFPAVDLWDRGVVSFSTDARLVATLTRGPNSQKQLTVYELFTGHLVFESGLDADEVTAGKLLDVRFINADSELISVWSDGTIRKHFLGVSPAGNSAWMNLLPEVATCTLQTPSGLVPLANARCAERRGRFFSDLDLRAKRDLNAQFLSRLFDRKW